MTERRPAGMPRGSWVDQLIGEAVERGAFDNLPGAGKPLPGIDRPVDEDWWIRQKLRSEDLPDEASVRAVVADLDRRVAEWIRLPTGPVVPVAPADADRIVAAWRAARQPAGAPDGTPATRRPDDGDGRSADRRWWLWRRSARST